MAFQPLFPTARRCRCDVSSVAFAPDDRSLILGTQDGSGMVWKLDLTTGDLSPWFRAYGTESTVSQSRWVKDLGYSREGDTLVTLGHDQQEGPLTCKTWNPATLQPVKIFSIDTKDSGYLFPEADAILSFDVSGRAFVWDTATGSRRGPVGDSRCRRQGWSFTPAGDAVAIPCETRLEVLAFPSFRKITEAAPWHRWPLPVPPVIAVSPEGFVAGTEAGYPSNHRSIRVWQLDFRSQSLALKP